jgi:hypothetical protein
MLRFEKDTHMVDARKRLGNHSTATALDLDARNTDCGRTGY